MSVSADWGMVIVTGVIAGVPGLLAAGGLWVKVNRLESDMSKTVSRELFDAHVRNVDEKLSDIKGMLRRALGWEDTKP